MEFACESKKGRDQCLSLLPASSYFLKQSLKCQELFTEGLGGWCDNIQGMFVAQERSWFKRNVNTHSSVV